jgi:hypothetical protein
MTKEKGPTAILSDLLAVLRTEQAFRQINDGQA